MNKKPLIIRHEGTTLMPAQGGYIMPEARPAGSNPKNDDEIYRRA